MVMGKKWGENGFIILRREQVTCPNAPDKLTGCCYVSKIMFKQRFCGFLFCFKRDHTCKTVQERLQDLAASGTGLELLRSPSAASSLSAFSFSPSLSDSYCDT